MEHGLILIIEAILAIDRRLQMPLRQAVPELPRLRADPRASLTEREVVFGPRRPYAVATVLGLIAGVVVLVGFVMSALDRPRNQPVEPWYFAAAGACVLVTVAAGTALLLHWLRGGAAVLRAEGVEFVYRGRSVFCPWALFQTPGLPYQPDHKRVILPANDATPVAVADADGNVTARPAAEVKARPLSACADGQVALADLYEVRLGEFGELLLHLGRQLGDAPLHQVGVNGAAVAGPLPLVTPESDGWLRVRLTRLPFPPVCSGCGAATAEVVRHVIDAAHAVQIDVPMCGACQAERRRRRTRAVLIGLGAGAVPAILWTLAASPFLDGVDLCVGIGILGPAGLFFGLIAGLLARDRADTARFRDYSPAAGTVAMRLRPTHGAAAFRTALGVAAEAEPAGVG
jgi:hypothetical protein